LHCVELRRVAAAEMQDAFVKEKEEESERDAMPL